jgi:hypothetical protein
MPPQTATQLLREPLGAVPEVFDPWSGAEGSDASVSGQSVAGAAACVMGKPL